MVYVISDASFDPPSRTGVGGYVVTDEIESLTSKDVGAMLATRVVRDTNNTRLEVQNVVWALASLHAPRDEPGVVSQSRPVLYTDCRAVSQLPLRRERLEANDYETRSGKGRLANADVYLAFFEVYDLMSPEIHLVKGHQPADQRDAIGAAFSLLDRAVRKELRDLLRRGRLINP